MLQTKLIYLSTSLLTLNLALGSGAYGMMNSGVERQEDRRPAVASRPGPGSGSLFSDEEEEISTGKREEDPDSIFDPSPQSDQVKKQVGTPTQLLSSEQIKAEALRAGILTKGMDKYYQDKIIETICSSTTTAEDIHEKARALKDILEHPWFESQFTYRQIPIIIALLTGPKGQTPQDTHEKVKAIGAIFELSWFQEITDIWSPSEIIEICAKHAAGDIAGKVEAIGNILELPCFEGMRVGLRGQIILNLLHDTTEEIAEKGAAIRDASQQPSFKGMKADTRDSVILFIVRPELALYAVESPAIWS